jgi:ABC-type transport system substrate-binding protein
MARISIPAAAMAVAVACAAAFAPMAAAADMNKTLRVEFRVAESGFDPQAFSDNYSSLVIDAIFDPLYTYDYFARPAKLAPRTADGLPQITDGGRTYTLKVRPGIYFADDPAFKGRKRELVAEDYVYTIKRMFDPKIRSYWLYLFENHLVGLDAPLARARKAGTLDYDEKIEGLQALGRYTLRVKFKEPNWNFQHWLTTAQFAAVAREVVDAYKDETNRVMEHPVGTGAYRLSSWTRAQKIVLEANPAYRDDRYPTPPAGSPPEDLVVAKDYAGKAMPFVGRIEISILEEAQPRLLSFEQGDLDLLDVPQSLAGNVLDGARLRPAYATRGIVLHRQVEPTVSFYFFNMDNPVVGGYAPAQIALRRAIAMGFDNAAAVKTLLYSQAIPATQPVPPPIPGYDPSFASPVAYDPAAARALLDRFGYREKDRDGYRKTPDGKPLTIVRASTPDSAARAEDELWKRCMDAIGIRMIDFKQKWPELNKMSEAGQLMMWGLSWIASTPDADTFYSTLYSKNIGTMNDARFRLPEYDRLYETAIRLPDGPERNAAYRRMTELVVAYAPWLLRTYPYDNVLAQRWVRAFKQHPFLRSQWRFYDVTAH